MTAAAIVFALFSNLFAAWFVLHESTIYYWNRAIYWSRFELVGEMLKSDPWFAWLRLWDSVRHMTYNDLVVWPLAPAEWLFGAGRLPYILSVLNVWMIPAAISFLWLWKAGEKKQIRRLWLWSR